MNQSQLSQSFPPSDLRIGYQHRMYSMGRHVENLLSLICVSILILIPVLFVLAHFAAEGQTSNFVRGWQFDPRYDLISTYTTRSPAGWAILACMFGLAYVLGFISWHAANSERGVVAWFTSVTAAIGAVSMLQIAWYPMKPSREAFVEIEREAARMHQPNTATNDSVLDFRVVAESTPMASPKFDASLRSFWIHQQSVGWAQAMIFLSMFGAKLLWEKYVPNRKYWMKMQWVALLWVMTGLLSYVLLPNYVGLAQRITYFGFYFWLLVVVKEIERNRVEKNRDNTQYSAPTTP